MLKRVALLVLLSAAMASAKIYTISISKPTQAGAVQLAPGDYRVHVKGADLAPTDAQGNPVDVPAKVETVEKRFAHTSIVTSMKDGVRRLESVDVGGSKFRILFE